MCKQIELYYSVKMMLSGSVLKAVDVSTPIKMCKSPLFHYQFELDNGGELF